MVGYGTVFGGPVLFFHTIFELNWGNGWRDGIINRKKGLVEMTYFRLVN